MNFKKSPAIGQSPTAESQNSSCDDKRILLRSVSPQSHGLASRWRIIATWLLFGIALVGIQDASVGQTPRKKPSRAKPPSFDAKSLEGVFFADVKKQLQGNPPKPNDGSLPANSGSGTKSLNSATTVGGENDSASEGKSIWSNAISPSSIEDLVKNAKLRLEGAVTTSAKFAGGGFNDARREYTLLAMLFGIIEQYPSQVRWKNSAPIVRMHMVRVAASSKVGSPQAYNEAKLRLAELADLINGTTITDKTPLDELNWGEALDRVPLMQLLEWALRENMIKMSASPKEFQENSDDILRFGELIGTIGEMLVQKGMTDADDAEYVRLTRSMIDLAQKAVQSVKLNNPEGGREAAALLNQSCDACHNVYR